MNERDKPNPREKRAGWRQSAPKSRSSDKPHYVAAPTKTAAHTRSQFWRVLRVAASGLFTILCLVIFGVFLFAKNKPVSLFVLKVNEEYLDARLPANSFVEEDFQLLSNSSQKNIQVRDLVQEANRTGRDAASLTRTAIPQIVTSPPLTGELPILMVYVSQHGVVNKDGEPCFLSVTNPLKSDEWYRVEDLLLQIKDNKDRLRKRNFHNVLVFLDCNKIDTDWSLGVIDNGFAPALQRLYENRKDLFDGVAILNSVRPGQRGWSSPRWGCSLFADCLARGLRGDAFDWFRRFWRPQINLAELVKFMEHEMAARSQAEFGVVQQPMLVGTFENGKSAMESWTVAIASSGTRPGPKAQVVPDVSHELTQVNESWSKYRAASRSPDRWATLQRELRHCCDLTLAGTETTGKTRLNESKGRVAELAQDLRNDLAWPDWNAELPAGSVYQIDMRYRDPGPELERIQKKWKEWKDKVLAPPPEGKTPDPPPALELSRIEIARVEWEGLVNLRGGNFTKQILQLLAFQDNHVKNALEKDKRVLVDPWELSFLRLMKDNPRFGEDENQLESAIRSFDAASRAHHLCDPRVHADFKNHLNKLDESLRLALDNMYFEREATENDKTEQDVLPLASIRERYDGWFTNHLQPRSKQLWARDDHFAKLVPVLEAYCAGPWNHDDPHEGQHEYVPTLEDPEAQVPLSVNIPNNTDVSQLLWNQPEENVAFPSLERMLPDAEVFNTGTPVEQRRLVRRILPIVGMQVTPQNLTHFWESSDSNEASSVVTKANSVETTADHSEERYKAYREKLADSSFPLHAVKSVKSFANVNQESITKREDSDRFAVKSVANLEEALRDAYEKRTPTDESHRVLAAFAMRPEESSNNRSVSEEKESKAKADWLLSQVDRAKMDVWFGKAFSDSHSGDFHSRAVACLRSMDNAMKNLPDAMKQESQSQREELDVLKGQCENWHPLRRTKEIDTAVWKLSFEPSTNDDRIKNGVSTVFGLESPQKWRNASSTQFLNLAGDQPAVWYRGNRPEPLEDAVITVNSFNRDRPKDSLIRVSRFPPHPPTLLVVLDCSQSMLDEYKVTEGSGQTKKQSKMEVAMLELKNVVLERTPRRGPIGVLGMGYDRAKVGVAGKKDEFAVTALIEFGPASGFDAEQLDTKYSDLNRDEIAGIEKDLGHIGDEWDPSNPTALGWQQGRIRSVNLPPGQRDQRVSELNSYQLHKLCYGRTPLYRSMINGINALRTHDPNGQKLLLVITDGMDNDTNKNTYQEQVQTYVDNYQEDDEAKRVSVSFVLLPGHGHGNKSREILENWANKTNGFCEEIGVGVTLKSLLERFAESTKFVLAPEKQRKFVPQDLGTDGKIVLGGRHTGVNVTLENWNQPIPFRCASLSQLPPTLVTLDRAEVVLVGGEELNIRYDIKTRTLDHERLVNTDDAAAEKRGFRIIPAELKGADSQGPASVDYSPYEVVFSKPEKAAGGEGGHAPWEIAIATQLKRDLRYFFTPHPIEIWVEVTRSKKGTRREDGIRTFPFVPYKTPRKVPQFNIVVGSDWIELGDDLTVDVWFTDKIIDLPGTANISLSEKTILSGKMKVNNIEIDVKAKQDADDRFSVTAVVHAEPASANQIRIDLPDRIQFECQRLVYRNRTEFNFKVHEPLVGDLKVQATPAQSIKDSGYRSSCTFKQLGKG